MRCRPLEKHWLVGPTYRPYSVLIYREAKKKKINQSSINKYTLKNDTTTWRKESKRSFTEFQECFTMEISSGLYLWNLCSRILRVRLQQLTRFSSKLRLWSKVSVELSFVNPRGWKRLSLHWFIAGKTRGHACRRAMFRIQAEVSTRIIPLYRIIESKSYGELIAYTVLAYVCVLRR